MPVFQKGSFQINLGFASIGGELSEDDRQCAWELYSELVSRVAVMGKQDANGNLVFDGEVYAESLGSLHAFFQETRALMRRYPVGRISTQKNHLGFFIAALLDVVLRPFLEKWQAGYRHWWTVQREREPDLSPFQCQEQFPGLKPMLDDWRDLRRFCRSAAKELSEQYNLPDVMAIEPPQLQQQWLKETKSVVEQLDA